MVANAFAKLAQGEKPIKVSRRKFQHCVGYKSLFENWVVVVNLVLVLSAWNGCAIRKVASQRSYRLIETGDASFLLPPDISSVSNRDLESTILLSNLDRSANSKVRAFCSVHDSWFSFYQSGLPSNAKWVVKVPLPSAWYNEDLLLHVRSYWDQFLDDLYDLQTKGCLSPETYEKAVNQIGESVPTPVFDAFFFRYSLDNRGFMTLRPGMRLVIDRAVFRKAPGGEKTVTNFLGERTAYYDVVGSAIGKITLRLRRIRRSRGLSYNVGKNFPDTTVLREFQGKHELRLFLLTLLVPPNEKRNALLLGSDNPGEMVRVTRKLEKDPEVRCKDLVSEGVICAEFDGPVTASVELNVIVNGREVHFPVDSTVQTALNSVPTDRRPGVLKTLRIQRLFRSQYFNLEFRQNDPQVLRMTLFAGDKISWTHE